MNNAINHGTAAPVASAKGLSPTSHSTRCILPSDVLLNALVRAKQKRDQDDRANAYAELLNHFHKAIFPAFFTETNGNLSEVSRLMGLHRETVKTYASNANIDMTGVSRAGGAL
jgi:DNA-binding protein Fis